MPYMRTICKAGRTKEIAKYYTYWLQPKGNAGTESKEDIGAAEKDQ